MIKVIDNAVVRPGNCARIKVPLEEMIALIDKTSVTDDSGKQYHQCTVRKADFELLHT